MKPTLKLLTALLLAVFCTASSHAAQLLAGVSRVDITDRAAVFACFEEIASSLVDVFALANVAGAVDQQPLVEITPERLERMNRININGSVWCAQAALATMKKYKDGRIINFSSKSGKTGSAIMAAYSAAKGAIISLTQAMAY